MSYYKLRCSYLHSSLAFSLYLIQSSVHEGWKTSTIQSSGMWQHESGTMKQCFRGISLIFRVRFLQWKCRQQVIRTVCSFYETTWHCTPDVNIHIHCHNNLSPHMYRSRTDNKYS